MLAQHSRLDVSFLRSHSKIFFYFWISAEVSQLFENWTEKLVPSFLFKLQPKMEEERLVTTDGWLGDCLKVKCLRSEASLHLLSFTFEFFTSFWCRFVFVQPLDNNQIYEECYKQEIYRVNLKLCFILISK